MASVQEVQTPATPVLPAAPVQPARPSAPVEAGESRFLIRSIDWASYRKISEALDGRHFRMSYDGRDLELMTISRGHGSYSRLAVLMVFVLTEETGMPRESCGDMTLDREDLARAIEADESFYLVNAPKLAGKKHIDLAVDPSPDLSVEIDLTTGSRRRLGIYSAIKVAEIWRFDGKLATILRLQPNGQYESVEQSLYFPFLTAIELTRFLLMRDQATEVAIVQSFRAWVRQQLGKDQP